MDRSERLKETIYRNARRVGIQEIAPIEISELEFESLIGAFS